VTLRARGLVVTSEAIWATFRLFRKQMVTTPTRR
jgi:hypothetical protein